MNYNDLIEIGAWTSVIFKILILFLVVVILILLAILLYYYVKRVENRKLPIDKDIQRARRIICYFKGEDILNVSQHTIYVIGENGKGTPNYLVFIDYGHVIDRILKYQDISSNNSGDMYAIYKNPNYGKGVDWTSDFEYCFHKCYYFNCYLPGWE